MDDEELLFPLRENLAPFGGNVGWIRDNMTREDWINYRPLAAALQPRSWSNGRIVLLGDAVHATTPHLASGAGMAVERRDRPRAGTLRKLTVQKWRFSPVEDRRYERCRDIVETSIAVGKLQLAGGNPGQIGGMLSAALHRFAAPF